MYLKTVYKLKRYRIIDPVKKIGNDTRTRLMIKNIPVEYLEY